MKGTIEAIRKMYGVPAKRGMRVLAEGKPGVITGTRKDGTMHLTIKLDGENKSRYFHPTWEMKYVTDERK
ncbi:TPA: hypothetical protein LUJ82_000852 [Acinetobacter baumannii]|jgi:hypothetical protein|uniref:hypothetical protein n=1 Tax=Acinetobacter TaxID=469 RepID=UPI0002CF359A|nr:MULTISPECIES: hypothetical protein [Acinetobacter calcoaceticus/baumannii complex]EKT7934361.1 hypothetical protein [Acinetobacter baumannii]EKT8682764.1 hypothetical protein [Acinetobacter baumannii]EKT9126195.1 hypothetical protein [Acinetobacter baumannii]EKT9294647.1 hypothetical protein [Acinetobacter baumannii]EKU3010377.1 hypothetical protein [Acinetobacter baumannii]